MDLEQIPIKKVLAKYLESLNKEKELDRILNSIWTKIDKNEIISLDLSRLGIGTIDLDFFENSIFRNLQYLYLQGNKLIQIDSTMFEVLSGLKGLNLPNNRISSIGSRNFAHANTLEWLNLSSNLIQVLDNHAFEGLIRLQSLNLSHNDITELEKDTFFDLSQLDKLNLSNNNIKKIQQNQFTWLQSLTELNLQSNKLIHINNELPDSLPNLEKLYLKHNPAFTVKNTFESRYEILEIFRSSQTSQVSDVAMTELLNFEDEQIIATFNQLIEDPRWDGGVGRVSNYKLSQVIGTPIESIARKIETLIAQKKLENVVHFDNNNPTAYDMHYWLRTTQAKGSINTGIEEPKCLWCNEELNDPFSPCPNCGLRCEICKFSIKQTQEFDVCTSESEMACLDIFHRSEYLEWVKIYGSCPKCSQEINLNLYQVSKDFSEKVSALVQQDMELPVDSNAHRNDFLIPMALSILVNLKKVKQNVTNSEEMIRQMGKEAREQHQEILKGLQPLATEIVLITAFLDRLEANTLTEQSFKASIDKIASKFDIFEDNIDLIFEAHEKDKNKIEKIKDLTKKGTVKGGIKGGEVGVKALVERSGLIGKIKNYVKLPTKQGLKSILNRIGKGIKDTTGDPTTWIRLGAVFLI